MKRLIALVFILSMGFAALAPTSAYAASCTDANGNTVKGDFCGVVDGECVCSDFKK